MFRIQHALCFALIALTLSAFTPAQAQRSENRPAPALRGKAQRGGARRAPVERTAKPARSSKGDKSTGATAEERAQERAKRAAELEKTEQARVEFEKRRKLARERVLKRLEARGVSRAELRRVKEVLEMRGEAKRAVGGKSRGKATAKRGQFPPTPRAKPAAGSRKGKAAPKANRGGAKKRGARGGGNRRGGRRGGRRG